MTYRGFTVVKEQVTQIGYRKVLSREHNSRKITMWTFTDSDGYERNANTKKEALKRIDELLK